MAHIDETSAPPDQPGGAFYLPGGTVPTSGLPLNPKLEWGDVSRRLTAAGVHSMGVFLRAIAGSVDVLHTLVRVKMGYVEERQSHGPLRNPANSLEPRWIAVSQRIISAKDIVPRHTSLSEV